MIRRSLAALLALHSPLLFANGVTVDNQSIGALTGSRQMVCVRPTDILHETIKIAAPQNKPARRPIQSSVGAQPNKLQGYLDRHASATRYYRNNANHIEPVQARQYSAGLNRPHETARAVRVHDLDHGRHYQHSDQRVNREDVSYAQRMLRALGYQPGPADGHSRPRFARALRNYQYNHDLIGDGQLTLWLLTHIEQSASPREADSAYYPVPPATSRDRPARDDSRTPGVNRDSTRLIQRSLLRLGYNPGPVDGDVGPRTQLAIRIYQQDNRLTEDGQASAQLMDHLAGNLEQRATSKQQQVSGGGVWQ